MISLQSHNQVLFHLAQLTAAVTPRRTSLEVRAKSGGKHDDRRDVLCYASFLEAANNCTEFPLNKIDLQSLRVALHVNRSEALDILRRISRGSAPRFPSFNDKWRISYISGDSFAENKRVGLNYWHDAKRPRLLSNLCSAAPFRVSAVTRGFKTERNVKAELERNPSFSGRLRRWMGMSPPVYQIDKFQVSGSGTELPPVEKLQSLLNEGEVSAAERQRVKVAFAEGYLAGHGQNYPVRTKKWYKVLQQIVMFGIFLGVLISFFGVYKC